MHATTILAYAYDAAMHCPHCTAENYTMGSLTRDPTAVNAQPGTDINGLPYDLSDHEGNLVTPLFACAVEQEEVCDDCLEFIAGTENA